MGIRKKVGFFGKYIMSIAIYSEEKRDASCDNWCVSGGRKMSIPNNTSNHCAIRSAGDLIREYKINTKSAIDVKDICKQLGINLFITDISDLEEKYNKKKVSGALYFADGKADIFVNAKDSEERQRFTIAHELGHYFLHIDKTSAQKRAIVSLRSDRNDLERSADFFAAELLMPADRVNDVYKEFEEKQKIPYISDLAQIFNVSKAAMHYRLDSLGKNYIRL